MIDSLILVLQVIGIHIYVLFMIMIITRLIATQYHTTVRNLYDKEFEKINKKYQADFFKKEVSEEEVN